MEVKNKPYVKILKDGILQNPITKENPYLSYSSGKGGGKLRKSNNKKGVSLMVRRIGILTFEKLHVVKQLVNGKLVMYLITK